MRIQLPSKALVLCTCKIFGGTVATLAAVLSGENFCQPNFFGSCLGYFMRTDLLSFSIALLAMGLLLSAFRDLLQDFEQFVLLRRDIESLAEHGDKDLVLNFAFIDN